MFMRLLGWTSAKTLGVPLGVLGGVIGTAFLGYQLLLPLSATRPYPDFWYFGADSYRISFAYPGGPHEMARYQGGKHPLFVLLGAPLHRVARPLSWRIAPEPIAENLALTFPVAALGALNVGVALLLFRTVGFTLGPALVVLLLYAGSSSIAVFSTFPDSYICTTLFTNLFLLAWLHDRDLTHWRRLSVVTALAGLAAPQQMLLMLLPAAALLARDTSRATVTRLVKYGAVASLLFAGPYLAQLAVQKGEVVAFMGHQTSTWTSVGHLVDPRVWAAVLTVFVSLALVLTVPPAVLDPVAIGEIATHAGAWLCGALVLAYGVAGYMRRACLRAGSRGMCLALGVFFAAYVAFFVWWTPSVAFIYSAPLMMPLWLILHAPWVDVQHQFRWRAAVTVAALVVVAHSAWTVATLPERDDYLRVRSRWEPPGTVARPPMA